MTQESIQLPTTPPLSGADLVANQNKANQALATDFAGAVDPAALAGPYMTWADTGNMLLKRRNAAGTAWVTLGPLLTEMAVKTGDAAQTFKAAPSTAADEVVVQSQVFGVGQTWQDVTTSRALGVNYTNTGTKPKAAYCTVNGTSTLSGNIGALRFIGNTISGAFTNLLLIIPPGGVYNFENTGFTLIAWLELQQ